MTSMLKSAVFRILLGIAEASSRPALHPSGPDRCRTRRRRCSRCSFGSVTSVCVCEPRQVCTAATCLRLAQIADVEDADAAEALGADRRGHALHAAVDAAAVLLDRHEQQVAVHRDVALPAGADDRGEQLRVLAALDVVGVEAVEVAEEHVGAAEREVRVGEVQPAAGRGGAAGAPERVRRVPAAGGAGCGDALAGRSGGIGSPAGRSGSKKPSGLGMVETSSMLFAATPASRRPGFRPTRGSLGSGAACCA